MPEKRQGPRIEINHEFRSVEAFLREYAMNVSMDGVFIRTAEVLPEGMAVRLRFSVVLDDLEIIEGEGRVVRSVTAEESKDPGMGVVFTSLTDESREVLAKIFTRNIPGK